MRPPGQTSRKGAGLGANKRRAGPGGWRRAPLARARPSPHGGLTFQSIIRFGMTGWVGDPTIGSPDLPSPPRGWSPAAGSAGEAPSWEPIMLWKTALAS